MCAFELRENALGVEIHADDQLLALYRATEGTAPQRIPQALFCAAVHAFRPACDRVSSARPRLAHRAVLRLGPRQRREFVGWALVFAGDKEIRRRRR